MKEKRQTYVQLFLEDVELNISVKNDLTLHKDKEPLNRFGYIEITNGSLDDEPLFWDNLSFFLECGKKEFKEECGKELQKKGYVWKEIYKQIKTLLKQAKKLNIIE